MEQQRSRLAGTIARRWRPLLAAAVLAGAASAGLVLGGPVDLRQLGACIGCLDGDLAVKVGGPTGAYSGDGLAYEIAATNLGGRDVYHVRITIIPPSGIPMDQFKLKSEYKATPGTDRFTIDLESLRAGQEVRAYLAFAAPASATTLTTTGSVELLKDPDPDLKNNTARAATAVRPKADLVVSQNIPTSLEAGSSVAYYLKVTNAGPSTATNVVVRDTVPSSVTPTYWSQPYCTFASGVLTCTVASLAAGGFAAFEFGFVAPASGTLTNEVSASAAEYDPNLSNNAVTATTTIATPTPTPAPTPTPTPAPTPTPTPSPQADLSVSLQAFMPPKPGYCTAPTGQWCAVTNVLAGETVDIFVYVTNAGPSAATNVVVQDTLPAGITITAHNQACTLASGVLSCGVASLAVGDQTSFGFEFTAPASGTLTNQISASATETDPNTSNNALTTTTSIVPSTNLSVAQTANVSGNRITYTITVTNGGPSTSTDAVALDTLPAGATNVAISSPNAYAPQGVPFCGAEPPSSTTTYGCRFNPIAPGGSATMTVAADLPGPGSYTNQVNVVAGTNDYDPDAANNSASTSTNIP